MASEPLRCTDSVQLRAAKRFIESRANRIPSGLGALLVMHSVRGMSVRAGRGLSLRCRGTMRLS